MANHIKYKKLIFRGLGVAIIAAALAVNFTFNTGKTGINARLDSVYGYIAFYLFLVSCNYTVSIKNEHQGQLIR